VWRGNRTKDPRGIFPTLISKHEQASDHAAIYADLTDFSGQSGQAEHNVSRHWQTSLVANWRQEGH
jgi:hypothetical protein